LYAIAALLVPAAAQGALFQFVDDKTGAAAGYVPVQVDGQLVGYTDMYGRIDIHAQQSGEHTVNIRFLGRAFKLQLNISADQKKLTVIRLVEQR